MNDIRQKPVLVIGAGIMGAGIAQVAAQAGQEVLLHDSRAGAAAAAKERLAAALARLVQKGKIDEVAAPATVARVRAVDDLSAAAPAAGIVIEAIVERLDAKQALFRQLEQWSGPDVILASNTSSISITALANGLRHPGRVVGMHFFNPVPAMALVEVVSGLHTAEGCARMVDDLARAWGKTPVRTRSTPGFIVNRIARPFYAEALALLQEQAATPIVVDACLRAAGFRMGPCELMDLIGHDTNFAVTQSVYDANFQDKRYVPSVVQREMVDGGLLGRKAGRGFYQYPPGVPPLPPSTAALQPQAEWVVVHGEDRIADGWWQVLTEAARGAGHFRLAREKTGGWAGLLVDGARLQLTDGRPAFEVAAADGIRDLAVFDRLPAAAAMAGDPLAFALNERARVAWRTQAPAWLRLLGYRPLEIADVPGLIVARTMAMVINEAADAVQQGVCSPDAADEAMKLGANYPAGPFQWLRGWGAHSVTALIDALDTVYRGERYRVSPWLRRLQPEATVEA